MKQTRTFLLLSVVAAVLILGVAYAAIANVRLTVNGTASATPNNDNFVVAFSKVEAKTEEQTNATVVYSAEGQYAEFTVSGLTTKDQTATVTLTIENNSTDIDATIKGVSISNDNEDYFEVTHNVSDLLIGAQQTGTITITVKLIKNPVAEDVSANISVLFDAVASAA